MFVIFGKKQNGFTLIELSIVLVIIGLIVGGVVGGQALIKSAKTQNLLREISGIQTGLNAFQLQYDALPGDFSEATDYWPTSEYSWIASGDGNGKLQWPSAGAPDQEPLNVFEHMIAADLLSGYVGSLGGTEGSDNLFGSDRVGGSHFRIAFADTYNSNMLQLLVEDSDVNDQLNSILTPAEMKKIDLKFDDGLPVRGDFIAYQGQETGAPTCFNNGTQYNLDEAAEACYFYMKMD
jgi:prepilin-type N-terminal cleavage/methylation domain-containing protein